MDLPSRPGRRAHSEPTSAEGAASEAPLSPQESWPDCFIPLSDGSFEYNESEVFDPQEASKEYFDMDDPDLQGWGYKETGPQPRPRPAYNFLCEVEAATLVQDTKRSRVSRANVPSYLANDPDFAMAPRGSPHRAFARRNSGDSSVEDPAQAERTPARVASPVEQSRSSTTDSVLMEQRQRNVTLGEKTRVASSKLAMQFFRVNLFNTDHRSYCSESNRRALVLITIVKQSELEPERQRLVRSSALGNPALKQTKFSK